MTGLVHSRKEKAIRLPLSYISGSPVVWAPEMYQKLGRRVRKEMECQLSRQRVCCLWQKFGALQGQVKQKNMGDLSKLVGNND